MLLLGWWAGATVCREARSGRVRRSGPEGAAKWERNGMKIAAARLIVRGDRDDVARRREAVSLNKVTGVDCRAAVQYEARGFPRRAQVVEGRRLHRRWAVVAEFRRWQ